MPWLFRTAPQTHCTGRRILPGGVFFLVLCRLRILRNATLCQFGHNLDLLKQGLDFLINTRAVRQRSLHQSAILKDVVFAFDDILH